MRGVAGLHRRLWRPVAASLGLLGTIMVAASAPIQETDADDDPQAACSGAEFRQFDFWLGDWDTYEMTDPSKIVARNRVTSILGGCVLREVYEQNDGLRGESYSLWDASRGQWHQSWVTNRGALLLLDGNLADGRMVLTGIERQPEGKSSLLRGVWWVEGPNVRTKAERSTDGGKTWAPVFDMEFRPHRPG
jgi:hypothetical protein